MRLIPHHNKCKKRATLDNVLYGINAFATVALLLSYLSPYFFIQQLYYFQLLGLVVFPLILVNIAFMFYWIIRRKKQFLISLIPLFIAITVTDKIYHFPFKTTPKKTSTSSRVNVMSYNVRLFNFYKWIDRKGVPQDIINFVKNKAPDIVCFQEFHESQTNRFSEYDYRYVYHKNKNDKVGLAIFSKWPIINRGAIDFPNTRNNTIYSDIIIHGDTIRLYNVHLESMKMEGELDDFKTNPSSEILNNIAQKFSTQKKQVDMIKLNYASIDYKKIVCGDFNNTSFSYIYNSLKTNLKDSFEEAGKGFGSTYQIKFMPLRIDFILVDHTITVMKHSNYYINLSDHNPIEAELSL